MLANKFKSLSKVVFSYRRSSIKLHNTTRNMSHGDEKRFKVLVTHPEVPQAGIDLLSRSCDLVFVKSLPPSRAEILEKSKGVDAMFWGGHDALNAEALDAAGPQLKSISTMTSGLDHVDIAEVKRRNIPLGHTPNVLSTAVADLTVGLLIAAARRFHEGRQKIDTGNWENYHLNWLLGQDIRSATVGFFGFGGIGQAIAKRLQGFDIAQVLYTTRKALPKEIEKKYNAKKVDFDGLLAQSDFVIIAAPLTADTKGVFNATAFGKMKKTAVLVNIARGPIVNQEDLYEALKSNTIFAAGLDVTNPEPLDPNNAILTLPNCVIVPHLGSATERTRSDMSVLAAHNVLRGLAGEPMLAPAY